MVKDLMDLIKCGVLGVEVTCSMQVVFNELGSEELDATGFTYMTICEGSQRCRCYHMSRDVI